MSKTYGARGIELISVYFGQSCVIYMGFMIGVFVGALIIIYQWWAGRIVCYEFRTDVKLEVFWTVVPVIFLFGTVLHSLCVLYALELDRGITRHYAGVVASQWYWSYLQPFHDTLLESRLIQSQNLTQGTPRLILVDQPLFLPKHNPIALEISATDVIHSFSLPSLGIKVDAVPGRNSHVSLTGLTSGFYIGFCSELCGSGHAFMPINVCVF